MVILSPKSGHSAEVSIAEISLFISLSRVKTHLRQETDNKPQEIFWLPSLPQAFSLDWSIQDNYPVSDTLT